MTERVLRYEIALDDMIAFNLHHYQQSAEMRRVRNLRWFARPLVVLAILIALYVLTGSTEHASGKMRLVVIGYLVFLGFLGAAWLVFFPRLWRHAIVRAVRKTYLKAENEGFIGARTLTLGARAIAERGALGETERPWSSVEKVDVTERHAFIYVGAIAAFIVPRHALASEAEFQDLVDMVKRLAAEAKGTGG